MEVPAPKVTLKAIDTIEFIIVMSFEPLPACNESLAIAEVTGFSPEVLRHDLHWTKRPPDG
jgi:hypothetical protein